MGPTPSTPRHCQTFKMFALIWRASHIPRQQITSLLWFRSFQSTISLVRSQLHHLEHQGFGEVEVSVTTAMLKRRGNTSPEQRHPHVRWIGFYWVLPELVRTVKRRQAAGHGCWIHEIRRRKEVLGASDKFQTLHPSQSSYKS